MIPEQSKESPSRKTIPRRSWVWKYYIDTRNESSKEISICSICQTKITYSNGTNNMQSHLKTHKIYKPTDPEEDECKPLKKFKFSSDQTINSKL